MAKIQFFTVKWLTTGKGLDFSSALLVNTSFVDIILGLKDQHHHHHQVTQLAGISVTLYLHPSLSSIASGRFSKLQPVSAQS